MVQLLVLVLWRTTTLWSLLANEEEKAEDNVDVEVGDIDERALPKRRRGVPTPQLSRKRSHHALRSQLGSVVL